MSVRFRLLALGMVTLWFAGCKQSATAPNKDQLADPPVVVLTPEAVKQALRYRDHHKVTGRWRLRIEVKELPNGMGKHSVDLDLDQPSTQDFEYEFEGIRVVINRSQIEKLRGTTVGYRVYPDREGFFVTNPNIPNSCD